MCCATCCLRYQASSLFSCCHITQLVVLSLIERHFSCFLSRDVLKILKQHEMGNFNGRETLENVV